MTTDKTTLDKTTLVLVDEIYKIDNQMRDLQAQRDGLQNDLIVQLAAARKNDRDFPEVVGSYGQRFKLAKPNNQYKFSIPQEEFDRLGITEEFTKAPSMNKSGMDDLKKRGVITDIDVANWIQEGWYTPIISDELTLKQLQSKKEDVLPSRKDLYPPAGF